ncbi:MAG TPA: family 78 glycoside hydrolase catalytic domain [Longimicrobiales bacterium]|nr:family 78 glycoside hydrolase catalytic domain [Longimicrobiales bacterium]
MGQRAARAILAPALLAGACTGHRGVPADHVIPEVAVTAPVQLTVGHLPAPVDVSTAHAPLLSWQVAARTQSAYQVQVATVQAGFSGPDVWDSGKVSSSINTSVPYGGPALAEAQRYVWRVRIWDGDDNPSHWSEIHQFGTAPGQQWGDSRPIWAGDDSDPDGGSDWAFLRGEVTLQPKPVAWATVFATGSSTMPSRQFVYKLWVNGAFVGLGPTHPIADETRFDGFDVTAMLRPGETNALGAIAYTTADRRFQAYLVIEYADGSRQTFGTGPHWKALDGSHVYPPAGSIGTAYYSAPKENLQAAVFPDGFHQAGFDDSAWTPAQVKAPFTKLQPTPTDKVRQELRYPVLVEEKAPGHYFVDYGRTWVGGLSLDITGTEGQVLDIRFGETLSDSMTVRFAMATGNHYQDIWTLRAGRQRLETWGMRVFRYVEVIGAPPGLGIQDFPALAQVYPFDSTIAVFESSDPVLNQVWQLSRNTIEATNHNRYVDSWTRERDSYEGDSYIQSLANHFLSADPTLGSYALERHLSVRTWPTEWPMYVILGFHDGYWQTGDAQALARNYEALKARLPNQWLEASSGLIRKDDGSNGRGSCTDCDLVDWPGAERDGYVFLPYNTVVNALAYRSYANMAAIAEALGKHDEAATFAATAARIRDAMNARLFDEVTGAYRDGLHGDGTPADHFAIHATVFATAFGVADAYRSARAAEYIRMRGITCSVFCAAFLIAALYDADRADVAHALLTGTGLRSWVNMLRAGAGATMEAWDISLKGNLSYSHPWSASPAYNIPRGMFGINPTTPGYATFDVRPRPHPVEWAYVTVPTLRGTIGAAFHTLEGRTDVAVSVPGNTTARVYVPATAEADGVVYVNGVATTATYEGGALRVDNIPAGCHVISVDPNVSPLGSSPLTRICGR